MYKNAFESNAEEAMPSASWNLSASTILALVGAYEAVIATNASTAIAFFILALIAGVWQQSPPKLEEKHDWSF
ncbi:TPA: hypothetical protein HA318_00730 [Candidatus Micrarchaeota archaeon]|nr:MAG: hypothetical protein AUJ65_00650 [Candidatus Micrarchaeota archaeon CG1_02_51_15]HII38513.1 hypothetical protein [Candidatus Micrarchaeota archaeon]